MNISERIKYYRSNRKVTQKKLADDIGKSIESIKKYEKGSINPPIDVLKKIAAALNTSLSVLLWDENKFIKDLLSYFQNAYQNNTNSFPKEYEIIDILINNSIITAEKAHIILNNYSNFSSEEIENLISFMKKLDINVYNQFTKNEDIKKIRLLGEKVSNLRKKNNLSLKELSTKCNLKEFYLKKLEKGFCAYPPEDFLNNIALALNVSVDALINNESFDFEILFEAINIGWDYFPGGKDVCIYLAEYINVDYKTFEDFQTNRIPNLPLDCIKNLLKFISEKSPNEFNKIYNNLIASNLYDLDPEIKDYGQQLYIKTAATPKINDNDIDSLDRFLLFINQKGYPVANIDHETLKYLYGKVNELLEFEFYKLENKANGTTDECKNENN